MLIAPCTPTTAEKVHLAGTHGSKEKKKARFLYEKGRF